MVHCYFASKVTGKILKFTEVEPHDEFSLAITETVLWGIFKMAILYNLVRWDQLMCSAAADGSVFFDILNDKIFPRTSLRHIF